MVILRVTKQNGVQVKYEEFPDMDSANLWIDKQRQSGDKVFNSNEFIFATTIDNSSAKEWEQLRLTRDYKLKSCDWTMLVDSPLSSEKKLQWTAYRQALRDLPYNTQEPSLVEWPNEPE